MSNWIRPNRFTLRIIMGTYHRRMLPQVVEMVKVCVLCTRNLFNNVIWCSLSQPEISTCQLYIKLLLNLTKLQTYKYIHKYALYSLELCLCAKILHYLEIVVLTLKYNGIGL